MFLNKQIDPLQEHFMCMICGIIVVKCKLCKSYFLLFLVFSSLFLPNITFLYNVVFTNH